MTYAIWIVSFLVGFGLAMQDPPLNYIGWAVVIVGFLVGYRIGKRRDEDRAAEKIARAVRDDEKPPPE